MIFLKKGSMLSTFISTTESFMSRLDIRDKKASSECLNIRELMMKL